MFLLCRICVILLQNHKIFRRMKLRHALHGMNTIFSIANEGTWAEKCNEIVFFGDYYGDKSTLAQLMHHAITWISMDQNRYFCGYGTELFENEKISATPWHRWAVMNQCAALQWCQNECDGISNHWRLDCLFNCLFRCTSKKSSSVSLAFVRGIHQWPVNSLHKRPVTWKMFPFGYIIMPLTSWSSKHILPSFQYYIIIFWLDVIEK